MASTLAFISFIAEASAWGFGVFVETAYDPARLAISLSTCFASMSASRFMV